MGRYIITVFLVLGILFFSFGKVPVSIEAESIHKKPTGEIIAEGNVIVKYKGKILQADRIVYDQKNKKIYLYGNIKLKTEKFDITAQRGWIDEEGVNGDFYDVSGILEKHYYIKAEKIKKRGDKYTFYDGEFSTCSFDQYDWYIKTKKGVFIKDKQVDFFNVSMRFCGVPVLFSPYFSYPASSRKTGFLFPQLGQDSYNDFRYVQPFFLILTRHSDMTFTYDYRNIQGNGLDIEYRNKLSSDSFYRTNFTVFTEKSGKWWEGRDLPPLENRWRVYGESELHYEDFDISLIYDFPSDPYFFEDIYNSTDLRYKSYTKSQLIALLDRRLFTVEINFDFLYDLTKTNNEQTLQRLPELRFYFKKLKPFREIPFYIDFLSVNTNFYREKGTSGLRSDNILDFELYNNFSGFSNLLRFSPRGTYYYLYSYYQNKKNPTRNIFSFEDRLRYTFYRSFSDFTHSVIPEITFKRVSKVNQEDLPYFDREDRIKDAYDIDYSLFNILNFESSEFLSWEISSGYTFNDYYYLGNNRLKGNQKPLKNRFYFYVKGFSGENTLYYDFKFNQIVRSITTFSIPVFSWFRYSVSHSYDKGIFSSISTINQINQTGTLTYKNISLSASVLSNIKFGYVQRKSLNFSLNRKCWRLNISYKEDYNRVTGKSFRSIVVYINILKTDIKLPFVSRTL
ncbi:LPS-assembly protein [Persephonella hydrogeniphila]|uniref:LPS-assembly protein n=1 Tax=Persephonella hydrogeniphila TaxID=198703 RepID=A0A285NKC8_9AQUI|nr:LPS-assembly protein LptD [Persephonella hydrogeniphila]SNZ09950.1 LPS-assembly protein [Persephonella hydrogeniphila]